MRCVTVCYPANNEVIRMKMTSWLARRTKIESIYLAAVLLFAALPASAQQSHDWQLCNASDDEVSLDAQIGGCTAVIESGKELEKNLAVAFYNRGVAYDDKDEPARAFADYNQAIRHDPKNASAFYNRGNSYRAKGEHDRAIGDYSEAIGLDPTLAEAFYDRGNAYRDKGEQDRALSDYSEAIRLDADNIEAIKSRAYLHFARANYGAAASDLARAVQMQPDDAYRVLWLYLSRARAGDEFGRAELERNAAKLTPAAWPYPVVEMFIGIRMPETTLAAADTPEARCEAQFYVGEWHLLRDTKAAATSALRAALNTCPKGFVEADGAAAELKRLGNSGKASR
jgi:lipoprotein NlpI